MRASVGYNLVKVNPNLAKQWHLTKNSPLTPYDVTPNSSHKVWWLCKHGHEWQAVISSRNKGMGCPYCSGRLATKEKSVAYVNPLLAKEWHPTKNAPLTPNDVLPWSDKKVWWLCKHGHEWKATVGNRTFGRGCPYCAGRYADKNTNLAVVNPLLTKEWHPEKNKPLTPYDVMAGSEKKVWWRCKRGHEWQALVSSRNRGVGCPYCHSQTSQIELRLYTEIKTFFPDAKHRAKIGKFECDIFIPQLQLGIEVDSLFWHKARLKFDKQKTSFFKRQGIKLIRIREEGLKKVSDNDIFFSDLSNESDVLKQLFTKIVDLGDIKGRGIGELKKYLHAGKIVNNEEYLNLLYTLPSPFPGSSLEDLNITLAKEWHPTKNGSLTPRDISPNSNKTVWWKCNKGHEWQAKVNNRNNGAQCPFCTGRLAHSKNCLKIVNPKIANEWHPFKNGTLTAYDVTPKSGRQVWWICTRGHEWLARIADRHKRGCPYCARKAVSDDNCLAKTNPALAKEWHPKKNGDLKPEQLLSGTHRQVWWICTRGHEWKASVASRNNGCGCPYCARRRVSNDNCLKTVNPELANQWHPNKNKALTPENVIPTSTKKVWWRCKKGHEWQAIIRDRNNGNNCPYCSGRAVCKDNCLATVNPSLAKEWHPNKNGDLTPEIVTPGAGKKIWWLCKKGHEWQAALYSRSAGNGCPYCAGRYKI